MTGTVRLGDVTSFIRGITFKPKDVVPASTEGVVHCMRTKNVQAELDLRDVWAVDSSFVKREEQYLETGDLLISSANSWNLVGKCSWVPELDAKSTFGGFVTVLRADRRKVDRRYLYYWFSMPVTQRTVRSFSRQTTNIANLDLRRCAELPFPLPPLAEQSRIAAVLDQVDTLRAKRREAIGLLADLKQSIFLEMFGPGRVGRGVSLSEVGDVQGGLQLSQARRTKPLEVPYLRVANVYRGRLDLAEVKTLRADAKEIERTRLSAGDLLVVEGHGNPEEIGRVATWDASVAECVHQNHLIRIRLDRSQVIPEYAETYLNSMVGRRHLLRSANTTSGLNTISTGMVQATPIMLPPLDEQQLFAERLSQLRAVQREHTACLATLDELFTSLQQRAFAGRLWDHEAA